MANTKKVRDEKKLTESMAKTILKFGKEKLTKGGYYTVTFGISSYLKHRLVVIANGIKIPKKYQIHHKDGNKNNNSIENLEVLSSEEHALIHNIVPKKEKAFLPNNSGVIEIKGMKIAILKKDGKITQFIDMSTRHAVEHALMLNLIVNEYLTLQKKLEQVTV